MVVVDGYIRSGPQFRTRARLIMEAASEVQAFVLSTGRAGGGGDHSGSRDDHSGSKKVTIPCSSAVVQGSIGWAGDPRERREFPGSFPAWTNPWSSRSPDRLIA